MLALCCQTLHLLRHRPAGWFVTGWRFSVGISFELQVMSYDFPFYVSGKCFQWAKFGVSMEYIILRLQPSTVETWRLTASL